jgi:hypothetical protein
LLGTVTEQVVNLKINTKKHFRALCRYYAIKLRQPGEAQLHPKAILWSVEGPLKARVLLIITFDK